MNLGGWEWAILGLIAVLLIAGYRLGGPGSDLSGHESDESGPQASPTTPSEPEAGPSDLSQR
ncbi:hypothetical protein ATK74_1070 [Propionicimonas paludicola]|uniref:Uncharacterized protein n=1 Tax=Propionicimonas paludicola TaxID=185243 RepID=A0A2A9CR20_9ACTN|nr:hypothetical protein [Propionicimonas paludicola]PFG16525.1 hypothetical protein ATK74_1070 [Propionicimonas paludicola]